MDIPGGYVEKCRFAVDLGKGNFYRNMGNGGVAVFEDFSRNANRMCDIINTKVHWGRRFFYKLLIRVYFLNS